MGLDCQVYALLCTERSAILLNLLQRHDLMSGESALHAQCWFPSASTDYFANQSDAIYNQF